VRGMTLSTHAQEYADRYGDGAQLGPEELNRLRDRVDYTRRVYWTDGDLKRIVRFRIIGCCYETPWWDLSYCYGEMKDGSYVQVELPFHQLPRNWKAKVYEYAKKENVYAKGLGIFDEDVYSTLAG
jgi:hypothetical protein